MKTTAPAIQEDCPLCQSVCQQVVHGHTMRFGRRTIGLDGLRKWVCGQCGFEFNDETQSAHNLQIIEEATRSHQGATTPGMLRKLRRHWGLTQATASRIFGAGPSSFAKWESGQSRMSQPSALLIQAATHVPGVMTYLAALARLPLRPHTETIWHRALMQAQRQSALALAEGGLGQLVARWERQLLAESARIEAALDFADEGDVDEAGPDVAPLAALAAELAGHLAAPPAERLRDGVRVVLAGPPNSGKSSLFNYLVGRDAAIVTPIAGTTRDRLEAPVALEGVPLLLIDTAGLREDSTDAVEALGIARSGEAMAAADIVLWLGPADAAPADALLIAAKADLDGAARPGLALSVVTGQGMAALRETLIARAKALLPRPGALALNARHRAIIAEVDAALRDALATPDLLLRAEALRIARHRLDALTGRSGVESMLDALFGTFCIGK